ncbi:hypothetical protein GCM10027194_09200 [Thalassiella azotivora]
MRRLRLVGGGVGLALVMAMTSLSPAASDAVGPESGPQTAVETWSSEVTDPIAAGAGQVEILGGVGTAYAPPGNSWGRASQADRALIAGPGGSVAYRWSVQPGSMTRVCVEVLGYVSGQPGRWYRASCGRSGGGVAPWDNASGYPKLRARSITGTGGFVGWSFN